MAITMTTLGCYVVAEVIGSCQCVVECVLCFQLSTLSIEERENDDVVYFHSKKYRCDSKSRAFDTISWYCDDKSFNGQQRAHHLMSWPKKLISQFFNSFQDITTTII